MLTRKYAILKIIVLLSSSIYMSSLCHAEADSQQLEQLDFANGLFKRGMYDMAINEYKSFINVFPKSELIDEAYFGIAESFFFQKLYPEAMDEYKKYLKAFPNGKTVDIANLRIAQTLFFTKQFEEALDYFNMVDEEKLDKNFKQIFYFYIGMTYKDKGNKKGAIELFEKAVSVQDAGEYTAYAFIELGDFFYADKEYEKAAGYYDSAYKSAESSKTKSIALHKKGEAKFLRNDFNAAEETFKMILDNFSDEEIAPNAFCNYLTSYFNMGEYEAVIKEYDANKSNPKFIVDNGKSFDAYYITASAYLEESDYEQALVLLDKLMSMKWITPDHRKRTFLKKLDVYLRARRFDDVLMLTSKEMADPKGDIGHALFMQAEAHHGMGNYSEAVSLYKSVIKDYSFSPFADSSLFSIAFSYKALGDEKKSIDAFINYFENGKDKQKREDALYNAILIEIKLAMLQNAAKHCKIFLDKYKTSPNHEKILFRLGSIYLGTKDFENAAKSFNEYVTTYKQSKRLDEAYFQLGYSYQLAGKHNEALKYYAKVQKANDVKLYYSALKNTALTYLGQGYNGNAAKVLHKIIVEFKDNDLDIDIYYWLVKYYIDNGVFNEALFIINKMEKMPKAQSLASNLEYFKGEVFRGAKNYEKAIRHYDNAIAKKTDSAILGASMIAKGVCYAQLKDYEKAKAQFAEAISENPEDNTVTMVARFETANIEKANGNLDGANKLYMLVAILYNNPQYCSEALLNAGEIFEKQNKKIDAYKAYNEIVTKYPKTSAWQKAKQRIQGLT